MSTEAATPTGSAAAVAAPLPTTPCSVVWSRGHAYVLERTRCGCRWVGVDDRGRPQQLTCADLEAQGWSAAASAA